MQPNVAAQTEALLHTLWHRNLPMIRERLDLLDRAARIAQSAALTAPLRRDAAMTAHKLAGSLGMFGYPEGTAIARKLEVLFDNPAPPDPQQVATLAAHLRHTLNL